MDLAIRMTAEELAETLAIPARTGAAHGAHRVRWRPLKLTPGWTNRLFVAVGPKWRGFFPLSGDVLRDPTNRANPYVLTFDAGDWAPIGPLAAPRFKLPKYVELVQDAADAPAAEVR